MQTSGIKIDLNSEHLLYDNSEKIEKVIKFAVKEAIKKNRLKSKTKASKKTAR